MATLDWLIILAYFAFLFGLAWWVIRKGKDTADDYFLAGRNLGWFVVGASIFASNIGSEHLVGLAGSGATSGVALAHYELHAWCLLVLGWVLVPFYMRSTRLHDAGVPRAALLAGVALGAVAHLARRLRASPRSRSAFSPAAWCSATLLPEMQLAARRLRLNSFWIGSVLGGRADRPLHGARRHARRRLHRSAADDDPRSSARCCSPSSASSALGGWGELRAVLGPEMFNLWKPLVPAGMEGTWAPVKEAGAHRLVLQRRTTRGSACCSARRSSGSGTGAPTSTSCSATLGAPNQTRSAARHHLRRVPQAAAGLHLHHPGHDRARAGARPGRAPALAIDGRRERQRRCRRRRRRAFPLMVQHVLPVGHARHGRGRAAGRAHELARRRLQRLLDAVHDRLLPEVPARRVAGAARVGRPRRDRR